MKSEPAGINSPSLVCKIGIIPVDSLTTMLSPGIRGTLVFSHATLTLFLSLTEHIVKKLDAVKCYESQVSDFPGLRSIEAVEALAKFRGSQSGFGYGEGFHIVRMVS